MDPIKDFGLGKKASAGNLARQFSSAGLQASQLGAAVELIERMRNENCTLFLSFTANMVASGLRGIIAEMCRKHFVDAIVTTAGSVDHDVIKTLVNYRLGSFDADDIRLHKQNINRIGNIFAPSKGYALFEGKMQRWLVKIYSKKKCVSPMELVQFIGKETKSRDSFLHWCTRNSIPVFCPGITDGAIGLQLYFFKQQHHDFCLDVTADMGELAQIVLTAEKTGAIVLGGGISKHHVIGANILRNGLNYAVYVSTATELDGSLSGARPREAKSWGKLREKGKHVSVFCDATIAMPLIGAALKEKGLL